VTHILDKGYLKHMLDEGHDERSISTCPRWRDHDIPNFLEDIIKDVEQLLLLDCVNEVSHRMG
jgi:hypothetical protein